MAAPNAQYMRQTSDTGGFIAGTNVHRRNNYWWFQSPPAPVDRDPDASSIFEPSPIFATAGIPAWISGIVNLLLHVACLVTTTIAAAGYLPPPPEKGPGTIDYTPNHDIDYVRSWVVVMLVCEWLCVLITVIWFGCVFKALSFPFAGHAGLALQLCATTCATKLSYWIAMSPSGAEHREKDKDTLIVASMYLGLIVIAGYITTPISGTYYKVVRETGAYVKADGTVETSGGDAFKRPKVGVAKTAGGV